MKSPSLVLLSDQVALQQSLDVVANNIANTNTTAFKRQAIEFDSVLSQVHNVSGSNKPIHFVVPKGSYRDASSGPIQSTGNSLDLAIQGKGYFEVKKADGTTAYTRVGSFQLDNQGEIVTLGGLPVLNDGGAPITIPDTTTDINVSGDGFVTAKIDNGTNLAELGKITVVTFDDEQKMQPQGNGLYGTDQQSTPGDGQIVQGALEQSNVQPVVEMTQMIQIQRSYEAAVNLISQENARQSDAISKLSKTTV